MKKRVLIVDDFETTTYTVGTTLRMQGYEVFKANNGIDALKVLDANEIDLLVTDYEMPGMNGAELIEKMRERPKYKQIPALVLSSETSEQKRKKAMAAGITGWIQKPYKLDSFVKIIQKALTINEGI